MHPSSPPPRNVDSTLARILRFVIKGYCYSPSRFLSSSRGKRNFRWLEKEIPRFFSLFFSLTDCSFHSITIKLPYRETFPELKKRFSFPERERERFVSQIKWPIVDTKDWNNYESSISLLLSPLARIRGSTLMHYASRIDRMLRRTGEKKKRKASRSRCIKIRMILRLCA